MAKPDFNRPVIDCTACGNCCVDTCSQKDGKLCAAHPTIVGEKKAFELRGSKCGSIDPVDAVSWGYYCPPVVEAFEEKSKIKLEPQPYLGAVLIRDWSRRYREEPNLREAWRDFAGINARERERNKMLNRFRTRFSGVLHLARYEIISTTRSLIEDW